MKTIINLLLIVSALSQFSLTSMASAKVGPFEETGDSPRINAPFPAILGCQIAARNLMDNADGKCIEEGYNYYVKISQTNCKEKFFGGYEITMKFTCR